MTRSFAKPFRSIPMLLVALITVFGVGPRTASANTCKADGEPCRTNQSCCSGACVNGAPPGSKPFGMCCTPTTCATQAANCGTLSNGTCPQPLDCGSCTSPDTCGGGGTANVCGCTPTTCAAQGANCGTVSDGCGGTLDCGTCAGTCVANVCCTPTTCAAQSKNCGTISDGCGGTLTCGTCTAPSTCGGDGTPNVCGGEVPCSSSADCISTRVCSSNGRCEPKLTNLRGCLTELDCLSGCCCDAAVCIFNTNSIVIPAPGICTDPSDCSESAATHCPLAFAPAQSWNDCH